LTDNDDELKALLALGVVASLAGLFQLYLSGAKFFDLKPVSPLMNDLELGTEILVLVAFAGYILGMTLALGFQRFEKMKRVTYWLRLVADGVFVGGAVLLVVLAFVYLLRIVTGLY
jgi:hypothetical protein